jgi:hypothetical protein
VQRFELLATCLGLVVDLGALLGFVGVWASLPGAASLPIGWEFVLAWVGIALVYSLSLVNSVVYRRYRKARKAQSYQNRGVQAILSDVPRVNAESELESRLLLAAFTSAPFIFAYVYVVVGETQQGGQVVLALVYSAAAGVVVVPVIAAAAKAFDMLLAAMASPD